MVEISGIEPLTCRALRARIFFIMQEVRRFVFCIKKKRQVQFLPFLRGGDKRDRTADLLNAIQALSQLSYTPIAEL